MQCFKSKCRCVARPVGDGCEMSVGSYDRLMEPASIDRLADAPSEKQCHPSDSIRKRYTQNNQDSNARMARLESRMDDPVSIAVRRQISRVARRHAEGSEQGGGLQSHHRCGQIRRADCHS